MNIFTQLKTIENLTSNERSIIEFVLHHPDEFLQLKTKDICERCFVSTPTLYRLCEKLGLSGVSEFKVKVSYSIQNYLEDNLEFDFDFPIKPNQTHHQIMTGMMEDYKQTLLSTFNLFDLDQLLFSVNAMKRAKKIDVYTSAGNLHFAENFQFQMQEIGIEINVPKEEYAQRLTASYSNEQHLAIVISFGGRGLLVERIIRCLKENRTPILLISSIEDFEIKKMADYHLYLCSTENHYHKLSSFSTRLSLLYILDVLFLCFFSKDYETNLKNKLTYYQKICRYDY